MERCSLYVVVVAGTAALIGGCRLIRASMVLSEALQERR